MKRPDYSGRWKFCAESSALEIGVPDEAVFTIEHREPAFDFERTLVFKGESDTFKLSLTIGAGEGAVSRGCATLYPRIDWDGDRLVFKTRVSQGGMEATNLVRYSLEDEGATLVAEESFRGTDLSYDNRWVFEKAGA